MLKYLLLGFNCALKGTHRKSNPTIDRTIRPIGLLAYLFRLVVVPLYGAALKVGLRLVDSSPADSGNDTVFACRGKFYGLFMP